MAKIFWSIEDVSPLLDSNFEECGISKAEEPKYKDKLKAIVEAAGNNADVCIDPLTFNVTIDQLRIYAYETKYSRKERKAREGIVKSFIKDTEEPFKSVAMSRTEGLDWNDDEAFRCAVDELLAEYEAWSAFDPKKFPAYGRIRRGDTDYIISRNGLKKGNPLFEWNYYNSQKFHTEHMSRVGHRYETIKESGAESTTRPDDRHLSVQNTNDMFFAMFNEITGLEPDAKPVSYPPRFETYPTSLYLLDRDPDMGLA